ncbi:DUF3618 domain-containing protein [uncultured Devosia sp.]|uniref:DUF3618 domain-containing protein n=1 Tax=uncultured Devosia sp. TaxID=211434 RepID=UPI0035CA449C
MAYETEHKSAAELEHEIEQQRNRVESTIDQIQDKLSPGQMVDELLSYGKEHGGGEFVSNLSRSVTSNPLPIALVGIGLAWLMAKPGTSSSGQADRDTDRSWDDSINARRGYDGASESDYEEHYPVTTISGASLQRLGQVDDQGGQRYSEFADDAGKKFRARSDERGMRAGHFMDEAGNSFSGFTDGAGEQIKHFRDEAGNLLDEASGWASHSWQKVREKMHDARDAMGAGSGQVGSRLGHAGAGMQHQADRLNQTIMTQFRDQPLVGGALAFAIGAALGSSLPHTAQEDAVMGEAADAAKAQAGAQAADLYSQGKEHVADLYGKASEKAAGIYDEAKQGVSAAADNTQGGPSHGFTANSDR